MQIVGADKNIRNTADLHSITNSAIPPSGIAKQNKARNYRKRIAIAILAAIGVAAIVIGVMLGTASSTSDSSSPASSAALGSKCGF